MLNIKALSLSLVETSVVYTQRSRPPDLWCIHMEESCTGVQHAVGCRAPHPLFAVLEVDLLGVEGVVDAGDFGQLLLLLRQPVAQNGLFRLQLPACLVAVRQILENTHTRR